MEIVSRSAAETEGVGEAVGRAMRAWGGEGVVCVALRGGLGAGKTQFARGLARGAGVADMGLVSSPTYVLMNEYRAVAGGLTVWHFDAYRVGGADDFAALGFEELLGGENGPGMVAVEWPERVEELLPADRLEVEMERGDEESERLIRLWGVGKLAALLQRLEVPPAQNRG
ncbi:MAG TPA: tRNA (adenosine(37)-N6)-threonylcarbamoyltransferase complex ATPase subunit type 1 TsaE [Phycisphaerae bacterium]|nr:tRNA (adenosine(37)-N6)-threonylcarbamoyltransferase complex ATPase subunit type 1 TsaE [Phycisphaerae bacterium]